jgi:phenylacetate-CoA ligase
VLAAEDLHAGLGHVNLSPDDWNDPDDRVRFLDDCRPEIYTGDPFAFEELARLNPASRPKALISSATTLLPGQRARLEAHFGCPVIDVYALNEAGPVAFLRDAGHEVLPHDLYVEIVDEAGRPVEPGLRGEITVTGGVNPNLPLVRYRTGDFAALDFRGAIPRLVDFAGRQPVFFRCASGQVVSSIDVTVALFDVPLPFFSLRQNTGGDFTFRTRCDAATECRVEDALREVLGSDQFVAVEQLPLDHIWEGKWIQYSSAL